METILSWLAPVLAFEISMFVTIYVVARAILDEQHSQEAAEHASASSAAAAPAVPQQKARQRAA